MKKAFTLLELLVVLSIIGVLLGLVVSVASTSVQWSREWKADALCKVVQAGLAEYKAREGKWPGSVDTSFDGESRNLNSSEVKNVIKEVVAYSVTKSPLMDVSQLHVAGSLSSKNRGRNFMEAIKGSEKNPKKMKVSEMYFGYPEKRHGYFRPFNIRYSKAADSMEVTK